MAETSTDTQRVLHDGAFVLTKSGSIDFGELTQDIAHAIKRQAGKIRLRVGREEKDGRNNYGEAHIQRPDRMKQLRAAGFENARDFVAYVASDFDAIYKGTGTSLIVCKKSDLHHIMYIALEPAADGDFYDVKSCLLSRESYLKNKPPLWAKPTGGDYSKRNGKGADQSMRCIP